MKMIITFQEFEKHEADRAKWLGQAIAQYMRSDEYKLAKEADLYEKQKNTRINQYVRKVYDITGVASIDFTNPNNRIASNFFHMLNTQRVSYSLGNGITFARKAEQQDGENAGKDTTKEALGNKFDDIVFRVGINALEHGVCYCFFNDGDYHVFPMTEFLPFPDEMTGKIRAGVRFWCLEWNKRPVIVDLYEEAGYSRYMTRAGKYGLGALELVEEIRPYKEKVQTSDADGEEVISGENYTSLPICVMYGTRNRQSTLVGMKPNIDAYDLIHSGYANDLSECAQVYWLIDNAAGMQEDDIQRLRDRMLLQHIVVADNQDSEIKPYSQEIPFNSREACLNRIKDSLYRDFGALDVTTLLGGQKTATEIRAAYQPMDLEADDFEYQVNEFIQQILALIGIDDYPIFKRNRIANEKEDTEKVMLAADLLDDRTILSKLPFVSPDEIETILINRGIEDENRLSGGLNE
jgi:hypothetical protein